MNKYSYKAKNQHGENINGLVEGNDERQALKALRERGLVPYSIKIVHEGSLINSFIKIFQKISLGDTATFTRQLSTMITAGMTVNEALTILRIQASPAFSVVIDDVMRSVEGGLSLSEALGKHQKVFGKVYTSLVKAGETGGVLDGVLQRLAENMEKEKEFQGKIKGAMIYPIVIVTAMGFVGTIMMIFVIPKLLVLYQDMQIQLPAPTQFLITLSNFMVNFWWLILAGIFGGIAAFRAFAATPAGRIKIDSLKLKLPVFGNLQKQIILTEVTRTLGLLVSTGISIIDALNIVAEGTGNVLYENALKETAKQVEKGLPIAVCLANYEEFPPIVAQMVSVGEETGKLDEVLKKLSRYFESESEEMVKGLTTAIEPLIMVLLGLGVGFLIIAIIMPIYNLTSAF